MNVPQPAFSDWFKKQLDEAKLSHKGFAERTGLSLSTVNNLKAGHPAYSKYTLSKILSAFGIKMSLKDFLSELEAGGDPGGVDQERKLNTHAKKPRRFRPMLTAILLTLPLAVFFAWRSIPAPAIRLVTKSLDERNILLHTENGEVIEIPIGDKILAPFRVKVGDEQLIVTVPYENKPRHYESATFLVFDSTGAGRWAYNLYDSSFLSFSPPYNTATLSGIFQSVSIGTGNFFADLQNRQVWTFANEGTYAVSRFTILDLASKRSVYSLWSWGRYYSAIVEDFDQDGIDEVVLATVNNNLGKMASKVLGKVNDFYLSAVVYIKPTYEKTDCIPGFYYQPECGCESVKWLAIIPHYNELVAEIGVELRGNDTVIRMSSELPIIYYVTPGGQFYEVFATHAWLEKYQTSHTPALIMMRVTETEITKEIIPTCEDGDTHFDLVYTAEEIEALMTLLQISMPLRNYVPSYEFNGQPITDIDD